MANHRTTFALDLTTVAELQRLAKLWNTSQAGVIRRSVQEAAERSRSQLSPAQAFVKLRAGAVPMQASDLAAMLAQLKQDRALADGQRV